MHPSTECLLPTSASYQQQPIKLNSAPSKTGYFFLSTPPKPKHRPQPITTPCSPPRSLPRATSRRRSSINSPVFQGTLLSTPHTPTSEIPKTPHLAGYSCTAVFATIPRRGSVSHVQEAQTCQARRVPVSPKRASPRSAPNSPKRGNTSGSPRRRHHRVPSSPFAPPSPNLTRLRAESTARIPVPSLPPTPPPRNPKLSKIRSFTNLRTRSPSLAATSRGTAPKPIMVTATGTTPKVAGKRAKRSATPARGSAAFAKYRPMPFIQQMQMIQFLEGGSLDSHIRRHHVHAGQGTAHTGFAIDGKEDVAHGYAFTDERGMIWFDEEEEWEFTCLLPKTCPQRRQGIKRFLGKRRDEESSDEWEDFMGQEDKDVEEELDPEVLLAREDGVLLARDDDLASFGGSLEGTWARCPSGQSVLRLPELKTDSKSNKRKAARSILPSTSIKPPAQVPPTIQSPHERIAALKQEFLSTAFAPVPTHSSPPPFASQRPRATSPFRMFTRGATIDDNSSPTLFQRHNRAARAVTHINTPTGGQSFATMGSSLRGGDILDGPAPRSVPPSPTVQWVCMGDEPLSCKSTTSSLIPPTTTEAHHRTACPCPNPESRLKSVSPPPAAARRLGIDPSIAVSLGPFTDVSKKQGFMSVKGFKSTKSN